MKILRIEYSRDDDKGILTQVNTGFWQQLNHLKIKKGEEFGGHYHKHKIELFYPIYGKAKFVVEFINGNNNIFEFQISQGNTLIIEPYEKHTITALSNCEFIELLSLPYTESDSYVK